MRCLVSASLLVALFAVAGPALASPGLSRALAGKQDLVSLRHGRGTAVLHGSGAARSFHIARGRIRIVDLPGGPKTQIRVKGFEHLRKVNSRTRVYRGRGMRFTVAFGRWRVQVSGRGINVSAAMRGRLVLRGTRGTYTIDSINPDNPKSWPATRTAFELH